MTDPLLSDDAELMVRTAAGDKSAFGELVKRHQSKVLSLAIRILGDETEAQDVAQDVFVKVYRAAGRYKPKAKFTTWLYRIAVNTSLDAGRRANRSVVPLEAVASVPGGPDATARLAEAELAARVRSAIQQLPPRQRTVVILHRYQELSYREIAAVTGWSVSAVESLLVRAHAKLRDSLADLRDP